VSSPPQLRPLGIGEILDVALKIYWRNAGTLFRIVVLVMAPVTLLAQLISVSATPDGVSTNFSFGASSNSLVSGRDAVTFAVGAGASVLVSWIGSLVATGACFKAVAEFYLGDRSDWRRSLAFAGRRLHSIVWVSVLSGVATAVGLVFCLVPGIYLSAALAVTVPVLLGENLRGSRALGRSRRLVRGRWWGTAGLLLLGAIMTFVVGGALSGLVAALSAVGEDQHTVAGFAVAWIAGTLAKVLTTPFTAAYVTVLYFDLRVRHEAFDLQLLAQRLGVEPPEGGGLLTPPPPEPSEEPPFWPPPPGWKPRSE
jgi:hypothetical protein